MINPPFPLNERERQLAVESYSILDTLPEKDFDDITKMCSYICDTPVSLITLMDNDRNWFKSAVGVSFKESPRNISFCGHAITQENDIMIVEDARKDERFHDNPLVSELKSAIFYCGVPMKNIEGHALGTLCVYDTKPRVLSDKQVETMKALARQVVNLFELKKRNTFLELLSQELKEKNNSLKDFAGIVSHDMKMPLANIITTTDVIKQKYGQLLGPDGETYMNYLKQSAFGLNDYITGMLEYYTSTELLDDETQTFMLNDMLEEVVDLLSITEECEINFPDRNLEITNNKSALKQIFLNLLGNAIKYNDKYKIVIDIKARILDENLFDFEISDNGMGIPQEKLKDIFNLFKIVGNRDRMGRKGSGIGLSTVKKLIKSLGGKITVTSEVGAGTTFKFNVVKPADSLKKLRIA